MLMARVARGEHAIEQVVRYRVDPPPEDWFRGADTNGWRWNSTPRRRLSVTEESIEVGGLLDLLHGQDPFWLDALKTRETRMWTARLSRFVIGHWCIPWPKVDCVALSCPLSDGSEYTLAVRTWRSRDLGELRAALRTAGVTES